MTKSNRVAVNRPPNYSNGFAPRDGQPLYPELWRGCVGAWNPGLGPSGLTLRDWSAYKNHGTLTNMASDSDWVTSGGRYALDFDGVNDRVIFPSAIMTGSGDFTITSHFRINSSSKYHTLQGNFSITNTTGIQVGVFLNDRLFVYVSSGASLIGATTLSVGRWYFCAAMRREGTVSLLLDGVVDASAVRSGSVGGSTSWRLGQGDTGEDLAGQLDDCRVYNRALSNHEMNVLKSRRGIAYELAPRRWSSVQVVGGFKAAWIPRRSLVIGGGTN